MGLSDCLSGSFCNFLAENLSKMKLFEEVNLEKSRPKKREFRSVQTPKEGDLKWIGWMDDDGDMVERRMYN